MRSKIYNWPSEHFQATLWFHFRAHIETHIWDPYLGSHCELHNRLLSDGVGSIPWRDHWDHWSSTTCLNVLTENCSVNLHYLRCQLSHLAIMDAMKWKNSVNGFHWIHSHFNEISMRIPSWDFYARNSRKITTKISSLNVLWAPNGQRLRLLSSRVLRKILKRTISSRPSPRLQLATLNGPNIISPGHLKLAGTIWISDN